ncbi:hypothetical protein G6F37_000968 [Rhizopus arrhizus]|nr:hypothetical protein G6F38_000686 [Rhizopus arrhizus]KAG1163712.1 hypothetical protein G6F37_000968 [Rhizopus arrhizus]
MSRFDFAKAIEELQQLRTTNERSSERITSLGQRIIDDHYTSKLGDQVWPFYEQVTIAALDTQNMTLANKLTLFKYCIDKLKDRFTESSFRFRRLLGMRYEAQGLLDEAQEVYDSILQEDETNLLASKRQIALLKTKHKETEMVDALTKYLDTYYDDCEAWLELCEVYASKHMYEQAAFCCEEMILLQPSNHIFYLKYAEICYTMHQFPLALKHYCKVLDLCTDHVRALYGLHLRK